MGAHLSRKREVHTADSLNKWEVNIQFQDEGQNWARGTRAPTCKSWLDKTGANLFLQSAPYVRVCR